MDGSFDLLTKTKTNVCIIDNKINTGQVLYALQTKLSMADSSSNQFLVKTSVGWETHMYYTAFADGNTILRFGKYTVPPSPTVPLSIVRDYKYQTSRDSEAKTKFWIDTFDGTKEFFLQKENVASPNFQGPKFILESDSWYQIRFQNLSGGVMDMTIAVVFYEVNTAVQDGQDRDNPDL